MPPIEDRLKTVWEAAQAGLITWDSVQQVQADLMPRCAKHSERSAPAVWEGRAICADCAEAIADARRKEQTQCPSSD